jgi:hypothetical protein
MKCNLFVPLYLVFKLKFMNREKNKILYICIMECLFKKDWFTSRLYFILWIRLGYYPKGREKKFDIKVRSLNSFIIIKTKMVFLRNSRKILKHW